LIKVTVRARLGGPPVLPRGSWRPVPVIEH
jgi:hypothetical protein